MNEIRQRVTDNFPSALLTLLSIVQALAVELLWSHVLETPYLFAFNWVSFIAWIQIIATFMGIILIWVVYSSSAMRFRWVPAISDSVLPFLIGILEFTLVETLGPEDIGLWLILLAMVRITHHTMKRARQDPANAGFFNGRKPAVLRDFVVEILSITGLSLAGLIVIATGHNGAVALFFLMCAIALLGGTFYQTASFWAYSIAEDAEK
jgi:hypothetical protein